MLINSDDVTFYEQQGYLVVPDVVSDMELGQVRSELKQLLAEASNISANNEVYDLEDDHTPAAPRVRRIKAPAAVMPSVAALVRHPRLVEILGQLIGPAVRFHESKLNLKAAGGGSAVEWHQDWAFYPHTNDDLLAVGILLDDIDETNGPLMVVPRSHRGVIHDHHANGFFCGAIDTLASTLDFASAVPLVGTAGSLTFHHVRTVHGSAPNRSDHSRNLLLFQFGAVDAFPLASPIDDLATYDEMIVAGESTIEPRVVNVPVRMPLPAAPHEGSIYEIQRGLANPFFD